MVASKSTGSRSLRVRLLLLVSAALLALLALEGLVRLRQGVKYGTYGPLVDVEVDAASGLRVPKAGRAGAVTVTERGFRAPDVEVPKPAGTVRLAFLGGSTTYCAEVSGDDAAWPQVVVDGLRDAFPEARIDGLNAGAPGYDSGSSLRNLQHRVADVAPDVIVIYHGTNDLAKDARAQAESAGVWRPSTENWLERNSLAWSLIVKNLRLHHRSRQAGGSAADFEFDVATAAAAFEERLRELVAAAAERTALVAVATFSHRLRPEMDADERTAAAVSSVYYMPFLTPDAILAGVRAYNDVVRRVCRETGALLIDEPDRIPADDAHYTDSVHLTDQGCRVMAERVLEELRAAERFRALLDD